MGSSNESPDDEGTETLLRRAPRRWLAPSNESPDDEGTETGEVGPGEVGPRRRATRAPTTRGGLKRRSGREQRPPLHHGASNESPDDEGTETQEF